MGVFIPGAQMFFKTGLIIPWQLVQQNVDKLRDLFFWVLWLAIS